MQNEPIISVIVPCYNVADELERCVNSIRAQVFRNLEIILVDDGSTDGTLAAAQGLAEKDHRIICIHKENGGVTSARLAGIDAAHGEWIGFVDGDDEIEPDMYSHLLNNALSSGADISHCGYRMVFADGRVNYFHNTGVRIEQDRDRALTELLEGTLVEPGLWNKLFNKKLFSELADKMDSAIRINEDLLMNFHLFRVSNKSVFEDFCPYHYVVRAVSASRSGLNKHRIYDPIKVKQQILAEAPESTRRTAEKALISTCINVYNALVQTGKSEFTEEKKDVRKLISAQKERFGLLTKRQKAAGYMIKYMPRLYSAAYKLYADKLQRNPYK